MQKNTTLRRPRRALALVLSAAVALGALWGGAGVASPSHATAEEEARGAAVSGAISEARISVVSDGTSEVPGDTSPTDGLLALGGAAGFRWELVVNGIRGGSLTQMLPEGWHWEESSMAAAGLANGAGINGYTSSYEIGRGGRELTLTLSSALGAGGSQTLEFSTIVARTDRLSGITGQTHSPTLTVRDAAGDREVTPFRAPTELTVVSRVSADIELQPLTDVEGLDAVYNFGAGPVAAKAHRMRVTVSQGERPGDAPFAWELPFRIEGALALSREGQPWTGTPAALIDGLDPEDRTGVSLTGPDASGRFGLQVDAAPGSDTFTVDIIVYLPVWQIQGQSASNKPVHMAASVAQDGAWSTAGGRPVVEDNLENNHIEVAFPAVKTPGSSLLQGYDNRLVAGRNQNANERSVLPGTAFYANSWYQPYAIRNEEGFWEVTPTHDVNLFDFWSPGDARLEPEGAVRLHAFSAAAGAQRDLREGTDYRLFYTLDAGPGLGGTPGTSDPHALEWIPAAEFEGERAEISGVRAQYIGNDGAWAREPIHTESDRNRLRMSVALRVVRDVPEGTQSGDAGLVRNHGLVTGRVEGAAPFRGYVTHYLMVRRGLATIAASGTALDASGAPADPPATTITAGQGVRYTVRPRLAPLPFTPADEANFVIEEVEASVCLPENAIGWDLAPVNEELWESSVRPAPNRCEGGRIELSFRYLGEARYSDPLSDIVFDVTTSTLAPTHSEFTLDAAVWAEGMTNAFGGAAARTSHTMWATQTQVAQFEKATGTPVRQPGESAEYRVSWFNLLSSSRERSALVDVLPYAGDGRGTTVSGPISLRSAELTADPTVGARLQITTDPAVREPGAGTAPAASVAWIDYATAGAERIAAATAVRVSIEDLVAGPLSIGRLDIALDAPEARGGEVLANSVTGVLREGQGAAETVLDGALPVEIEMRTASLAGRVWHDADASGIDEAEPALAGVEVALLDASGAPATDAHGRALTARTDDSGAYRFEQLLAGEYVVRVDPLSITPTGVWRNTAAPGIEASAPPASVSAPLALSVGQNAAELDFGYVRVPASISLEKRALPPVEAVPGAGMSFDFTLTNTGTVGLEGVELSDPLPGLGEIVFGQWPDPARPFALAPGESVRASAGYALRPADLDAAAVSNTATASGQPPMGPRVSDTDSASLALAAASGLSLSKTARVLDRDSALEARAGDIVEYRFELRNTGAQTLSEVSLSDALEGLGPVSLGPWPGEHGTLRAGQAVRGSASLVLTQEHIDAGRLENEARAGARAPGGGAVDDRDTAVLLFDNAPAIGLSKTAEAPLGALRAGSEIEYVFRIENTGPVALSGVELIDGMPGLGTPEFSAWPNPEAPGTLAPGEAVEARAGYALTQADLDAGEVRNLAEARGASAAGERAEASASARLLLAAPGLLALEKTGEIEAGGEWIRFGLRAENTGAVTLRGVELSDRLPGLGEIVYRWPGEPGVLSPGEALEAEARYRIGGADLGTALVNEASAAAVDPSGEAVTASDRVAIWIPARDAGPGLPGEGGAGDGEGSTPGGGASGPLARTGAGLAPALAAGAFALLLAGLALRRARPAAPGRIR